MSVPLQTIERLERELFELISTAQRNGLSPSMAIAAGARPFLERLLKLEKPHEPPPVGEVRLCLVCAYEKPWGVFDTKSGAAVCVDCRDKARSIGEPHGQLQQLS